MTEKPKFDINSIIETYQIPEKHSERYKQATKLLQKEGFINEPGVFGLIGTGGTLSSGYSPKNETIVPGKYRAAEHVIKDLKEKFMIIPDSFSSLDIFAKDSREIKNEDIILLLDILNIIQNKRILIVCGTYMLPLISAMLLKLSFHESKIIGITGSMLPSGFTLTDAPINIMSAVTAINQRTLYDDNEKSNIMAIFHGQLFDNIESLEALDLHPEETDNLIIGYPHMSTPSADDN